MVLNEVKYSRIQVSGDNLSMVLGRQDLVRNHLKFNVFVFVHAVDRTVNNTRTLPQPENCGLTDLAHLSDKEDTRDRFLTQSFWPD